MSTIKSADEHLTLNADGSGKAIKFQADGVEKASINSSGLLTSTTIDATALTGNLPALNASSLTSIPAANITGTLPAISGANLTGISGGKVLQVVQGSLLTTVSSINSTTPAATGITADITTTEDNSKILALCMINGLEKTASGGYIKLFLYRGTTEVVVGEGWTGYGVDMTGNSAGMGSSTIMYMDSPTHTATTTLTYNIYFKSNNGEYKVNVQPSRSGIVLLEIGA